MIEAGIAKIKQEEGFCGVPYNDTRRFLTILYGWNLSANPLPEIVGDFALRWKIKQIESELISYTWYNNLDIVRQTVIADMAFQMGVAGVAQFHGMIAAIEQKNYAAAAAAMLASEWAEQTQERAQDLAGIMRSGVFD